MSRFGSPVPGPRIVPFGEDRETTDVLPNGRAAFRVTSPFGATKNRARPHDGLDVGNFHAGDPVVAMRDGVVSYTEVAQGIVRLDHGDGWSSGSGHMTRLNVSRDQNVRRGHVLGYVGKAGTTEVHLHFDITHNGVRRDPWPLLEQNQEPDMKFRDPTVTEQWTIRKGATFTRARDGSGGAFTVPVPGVWSIAELDHQGVDSRLLDYGGDHELLIIPRAALDPVKGTRVVGAGLAAALTKIARARTALGGAGQAVTAANEALK